MKLPTTRQYPKKLVIKDRTYTVKFVRKIKQDASLVGLCEQEHAMITIKLGMSAAETFATFIHECLHAMEFEYNLKIEHSVVYGFEKAITDFLLMNF